MDAAAHAHALGVPVFTIALGTEQGMVDVPNETGQLQRVPVPPDELTLRRIAEVTGARFFAAPTDRDLRGIYRELGSKIGFVKERQEVTVVFAAAGLLLVVAGMALSLAWFSRFP
jgi:Ca-activated chloride channel family protein